MNTAIVAFLIEEIENDDEDLLLLTMKEPNRKVDDLFSCRKSEGAYAVTVERRLFGNEIKFQEYFRLSRELFEIVLKFIREDIVKKPCNRYSHPITPEEKLCITLRYMATGESFRSLAFQYRISHSWISVIVRDVLQSIRNRLCHIYIPEPTQERMLANAQDYYDIWNYPNCCASIDGKHIRIICPDNAGSLFFNYKQFHSIVLLAMVDARYRFVAIDVGSYGREGDAAIFAKSNMGKKINANNFNFPHPKLIPGTTNAQPFVILGDEAFSLTETMMKPYPKRQSVLDQTKAVYNYRHCRARRTSENAFGIMCQYFRVFYTPIAILADATDDLIISACILHNMLRNSRIPYPKENSNNIPDLPKDNMLPLAPTSARRPTFQANQVRDTFKAYFNSPNGSLPWQDKHVARID